MTAISKTARRSLWATATALLLAGYASVAPAQSVKVTLSIKGVVA